MKINRGATCYFKKWITKKKLQELKEIIVEYSRIANYFIETYENDVPSTPKLNLCKSEQAKRCIMETNTFLTSRMIKQAFREAYGCICTAKSNAKNKVGGKYIRPVFKCKRMVLSENSCHHEIALNTKQY